MLKQILTLELGNDHGLLSFKNIIKLLYTYIFPNISAIILAHTMGLIKFYEPKQMLLLILALNVLVMIIIQYFVQRHFFNKLDREVLLKFIPIKTLSFVKLRLHFLVIKFYLPVLLFTIIYISYFIQDSHLFFTMLSIFSIVFILAFQIYLAIIIRYCVNTFKTLYLHVLQIILFLLFIVYCSFFMFVPVLLLEMIEDFYNDIVYAPFSINPVHIFIVVLVFAVLSVIFLLIIEKVNINLIVYNRNLSLRVNTVRLEQIHEKVYGFGLNKIQKLLFRKDIKYIFRNSKVLVIIIGLYHVINFLSMAFFFSVLSEISDAGVFFSKFYLIWVLGTIILSLIMSAGYKDILDFENDFNVVKSYHIELSTSKLIKVKTKVLRAFVFPKLTIIHTVFIVSVLLMNQNKLALIYLLNYFICFICRKTAELWRVKNENKLNSDSTILNIINFILIFLFINLLLQLLNGSNENIYFFQLLSLGAICVLYFYHQFIYQKKEK